MVQSSALTVLMATYNGATFVNDQIESLVRQRASSLELIVSDDGSSDGTLDVIRACAAKHSTIELQIIDGPQEGFAKNFRSLVLNTKPKYEHIAFCDQDDIWFDDKFSRAIASLPLHNGIATVHCGRTQNVAEDGRTPITMSPLFKRPPSFRNAIAQSIAGGNTITMNKMAFNLLRESLKESIPVSHDWWTYLVVTGAGGKVIYDPDPLVYYRQHGRNVVGSNVGSAAKLVRLISILNGRFREWNNSNVTDLRKCEKLLTEEARYVLEKMETARGSGCLKRLKALRDSGAQRQSRMSTFALYVACALGRI